MITTRQADRMIQAGRPFLFSSSYDEVFPLFIIKRDRYHVYGIRGEKMDRGDLTLLEGPVQEMGETERAKRKERIAQWNESATVAKSETKEMLDEKIDRLYEERGNLYQSLAESSSKEEYARIEAAINANTAAIKNLESRVKKMKEEEEAAKEAARYAAGDDGWVCAMNLSKGTKKDIVDLWFFKDRRDTRASEGKAIRITKKMAKKLRDDLIEALAE